MFMTSDEYNDFLKEQNDEMKALLDEIGLGQ